MRCRSMLAGFIFLAVVFSSIHVSHALIVEEGLQPHQVVPCDIKGKGRLSLAGTASSEGAVQARVMGMQKEILGWQDLGSVSGGHWEGAIAEVPAGGPYRVEVQVVDAADAVLDTASVYDVLVGDLWILAGQSNMQGVGNRDGVEEPHPQVHTFSMSHEWRLAQEPLHTLAESPDVVHCNAATDEERQKQIAEWRDGPKGAGLGMAFAKELLRRTGRPIGLIASAHGGTSMAQWDPALRDKGGESLYGSMYKQVKAAGGPVRGVVWYQGESDANKFTSLIFKEKLKELVAAMRADFEAPELPFYQVQIGRFVIADFDEPAWHRIQTEQLAAETEIPHSGLVAAIDVELDDLIHAGTEGLKTLGRRLAKLAEHDLFDGAVERGPRFKKLRRRRSPFGHTVHVMFSDVNGSLQSAGRLSGFGISTGPEGDPVPCIYDQRIDSESPDTVILWIQELPEDAHLWYGRGMDPYCNLVDSEDMAAPVFGPVPISK